MTDSVAAVVTTFRPDARLPANLSLVAQQVAHTIVVDDTGADVSAWTPPSSDALTVIQLPENRGIATALNVGIRRAADMGYTWVLTLDDDTRIRDGYVAAVLEFLRGTALANVGIVTLSRPQQQPAGKGGKDRGYSLRRNAITSGSFFSIDLFDAVGGFSDEWFIDLVDFDFCCKVRKLGRRIVTLDKVGMDHKVGNSERRRILAFETTVYHHAPFRNYYQARNAVAFARRHFAFDPLLCAYLLLDLVRLPAKTVLFETDKLERLRLQARGLVDGLTGRLGKIR